MVAAPIEIRYLNHDDVQALAMTDAEILAAVERGLAEHLPRHCL